jgi:hypothetical protein
MQFNKTVLLFFVRAFALICCLFVFNNAVLNAQSNTPYSIAGKVMKGTKSNGLANANVTLVGSNKTIKSDTSGNFLFEVNDAGKYTLFVNAQGCLPYTVTVEVLDYGTTNITVVLQAGEDASKFSEEDLIPVISIDESSDRSQGGDYISGVLTASRDVFVATSAFTLGPLRFRIRGLDGLYSQVHINGIPVNEIENGRVSWNVWGGLNDVLRDRDIVVGNAPAAYGMGGIGGASNMNVRAANQWKQTRISSAVSNRNYRQRLMFTHNTGLMKNGWAFSVSGSFRYADEGYIPGTNYDAWSYFASAEKKINNKHSVSASLLASAVKSALPGGSFQEVYDLASTPFYNPNWGYQNGEKRSARVRNTHQPLLLLNHDWKINTKTKLETGLGLQTGRTGVTAMEWYNAPDPRPDYYRKLPSFAGDEFQRERLTSLFQEDEAFRQINWHGLYNVNYNSIETIRNVDGIEGNNVTGKRAKYILEERRSDIQRVNFNAILTHKYSDRILLYAGTNAQVQQVAYFKTVHDLLGADFYVNLNQFAERDIPNDPVSNQHDINNPNRILKEGDRFGYDYTSHTVSVETWAQIHVKLPKWDMYAAGSIGQTSFKRIGNVQNGLFPNNSLGNSDVHKFILPFIKAGATYKLNGRNYFLAKLSSGKVAPQFRNVFVSPRTRDQVASNLKSEDVQSAELGYLHVAPGLKIRAMAYIAQINNQIRTQSFYHDEKRTFVNNTLSGLNALHKGLELGAEVKLTSTLSITGVAALGDNKYTSRPTAEITEENRPELIQETELVYLKNFYVSGTPQTALSAGLNYRSPNYWFLNANINYINHFYLDPNPIRRTTQAIQGVEPGSDEWKNILYQEKLPAAFTVDLFGGYSIKLNKYYKKASSNTFVYFNIGVSNVLNNLKVITGGFEQMRFDFVDKDVDRFPPRYFYNYGRNYFVNLTLKF